MNRLTWPAVGMLAVVGAIIVSLAAFTDWTSSEIIAVAGILFGVSGGAAIGGAVAGRVDELHDETRQVAQKLNGEFEPRVAAIVRNVLRDENVSNTGNAGNAGTGQS